MIWTNQSNNNNNNNIQSSRRQLLAAPKPKLPGHSESYNPPEEYLGESTARK